MTTYLFDKIIVIQGSPIEVVITGTKRDLNGVLVRTDNAQLDLVGFALSDSGSDIDDFKAEYLRPTSRQMNSVESYPLEQIPEARESRKSGYTLCWVGYCSEREREKIEKVFKRHIADIKYGIDKEDTEIIENGLSPVIYHCQMVHLRHEERLKKLKFNQYAFVIFTLVMVLIFTLVFGLNFVAKYITK